MSQFQAGDRVYVNFVSDSATAFSGKQFSGEGTLDRAEDGYLFGRRDDGLPFMCNEADAVLIMPQPEHSKAMNKVCLLAALIVGAGVLKSFGL